MTAAQAIALALLLANLASFAAFAVDKRRARRSERRISEAALIGCGALGPVGAWVAVGALRHKTRKPWFLGRLALASALLPAVLWAMFA
jgi:uncharacterized membrane protein YsdA (DUF1294 family)